MQSSLMPWCCLSFASDSEKHFSFAQVHVRFVVLLRSPYLHAQRGYAPGWRIKCNLIYCISSSSLMFLDETSRDEDFIPLQPTRPEPSFDFCGSCFLHFPNFSVQYAVLSSSWAKRCCARIRSPPCWRFREYPGVTFSPPLKGVKSVVETSDIIEFSVCESWLTLCKRFPPESACWIWPQVRAIVASFWRITWKTVFLRQYNQNRVSGACKFAVCPPAPVCSTTSSAKSLENFDTEKKRTEKHMKMWTTWCAAVLTIYLVCMCVFVFFRALWWLPLLVTWTCLMWMSGRPPSDHPRPLLFPDQWFFVSR